jgi:hypothetical protein
MAANNEHPVLVPNDLASLLDKEQRSVDSDTGNYLRNPQINLSLQELVNLKEDMMELNKILNMVERYSVRDTLMAEISLISAKIDSLQVTSADNPNKDHPWTEVVKGRKNISLTQRRGPFNIPVIHNRYNLLPLSEKCKTSQSASVRVVQRASVSKTHPRKKNKIVIMGDSHARRCASEVLHNLDNTYEVQGIVKPSANMEAIVAPPIDATTKLKKKDVVIIWGGSRDTGKNESEKALCKISNFAWDHHQTNVIVISAPFRYDLAPDSCVNEEVTRFNLLAPEFYI